MGIAPTSSNQLLESDVVDIIMSDFGFRASRREQQGKDVTRRAPSHDPSLPKRSPIVAIVGHINHGKTSLLDALRQTNVAKQESGGITQHIGPFEGRREKREEREERREKKSSLFFLHSFIHSFFILSSIVQFGDESITFIDTPGHEVFVSMREVALDLTDIAVLLVAADDGVQEQTLESIKFLRQNNKPFVVALNKVDKHNADIDRVKRQLLQQTIMLEEFGGDVPCVSISAKTGIGLEDLGAALLLQAELLELRSDSDGLGECTIVESFLHRGFGFYAAAVVRAGTLKKHQLFVCGDTYGKIRLIQNSAGEEMDEAKPARVVHLAGFKALPQPGDDLISLPTEREVKVVHDWRMFKLKQQAEEKVSQEAVERKEEERLKRIEQASSSDTTGAAAAAGNNDQQTGAGEVTESTQKELTLIVKADTRGTLNAIKEGIEALPHDPEVKILVAHADVGAVSESDINLARTTNAIILGFNIARHDARVDTLARHNAIPIAHFDVVYQLLEHIKNQASTLLGDRFSLSVIGRALVQQTFDVTMKKTKSIQRIAGCRITLGSITRGSLVRVVRKDLTLFEGKLASLKHIKDDVREAKSGSECGIQLDGFDGIEEGDFIEAIKREKGKWKGRRREEGGKENHYCSPSVCVFSFSSQWIESLVKEINKRTKFLFVHLYNVLLLLLLLHFIRIETPVGVVSSFSSFLSFFLI
jgi:translation initiation factor IF-2